MAGIGRHTTKAAGLHWVEDQRGRGGTFGHWEGVGSGARNATKGPHGESIVGDYSYTPPPAKKVAFLINNTFDKDPDSLKSYRDSFYAGLYYAEMIKTGDGHTLFDLITKCGRLKDPASGASLSPAMQDHRDWWVYLQYFPTFKMAGDTQSLDLQILFDRDGAKLTARSALFSSHLLDGDSFMHDHGIECL